MNDESEEFIDDLKELNQIMASFCEKREIPPNVFIYFLSRCFSISLAAADIADCVALQMLNVTYEQFKEFKKIFEESHEGQ